MGGYGNDSIGAMIFLKTVRYSSPPAKKAGAFPFNVPIVQALSELEFSADVTFFVGENGSGKSTLLESVGFFCGKNCLKHWQHWW